MDKSPEKPGKHEDFWKCTLPNGTHQTFRLLVSMESTEHDTRTNLFEAVGLLQKN